MPGQTALQAPAAKPGVTTENGPLLAGHLRVGYDLPAVRDHLPELGALVLEAWPDQSCTAQI